MDQICIKSVFPIKNRKNKHHHWILHIWISLGTKFQLKTDHFDFLDQICPKRVFPVKNKKSEHHHWILHVPISAGTKFQLKLIIFYLLDRIWTKRIFPFKNKKRDQHHLILHIRISLGTKFQLQLIILTFGPNLPKKHSSDQKQKKWTSPLNSAYSNLCRHQISASTDILTFWTKFAQK